MILLIAWIAAPGRDARATDYRLLDLRELTEMSAVIVLVDFTVKGELLKSEIKEVLKGEAPKGFQIESAIHSYTRPVNSPFPREEGVKPKEEVVRYALFGHDARIGIDDLQSSSRRLVFLKPDGGDSLQPFHPGCIQLAKERDRVLRMLAMGRNPAPFLAAPENAGDLDLIYILGERFFAFQLSFVGAPGLPPHRDHQVEGMPAALPWQRIRLAIDFTYQADRDPQLQSAPLAAQGALPRLFRKVGEMGDWRGLVPGTDDPPPARFSMIVDTTGPEKVGETTQAEALSFLRAQLRSSKMEVVREAYTALIKLLDLETVPAAIEMLRHAEPKWQAEAARFLSYAKDPRAVEPLCAALEALPPRLEKEPSELVSEGEPDDVMVAALMQIGSPKALPALKRAALKGHPKSGIGDALGRLGDQREVEPLIEGMATQSGEYNNSHLLALVWRSNCPAEPWMKEGLTTGDEKERLHRRDLWQQWWARNKEKFRVEHYMPFE